MAVLLLLPAAAAVRAQETVTPIAPGQPAPVPPPPAQPAYTRPQLEGMLAPIALYPDQLLGQILMASAYPLEIVEADRWARDPAHAGLKGPELEAALAPIDWDPSVKSLVPFPQILATMDQHLDWTQGLGVAFVSQQAEVMDTVQFLRRQAAASGYLRSTPQMSVVDTGEGIVVEPASPQLVYLPVYDPTVVYGPWPYAGYPPVEIYAEEYYSAPIFFSAGFVVARSFWGWNRCDWAHHRVWVDPRRVNAINAALIERRHEAAVARHTWQFDPHHRRGLAMPASAPAAGSSFRAAPRTAAPPSVSHGARPAEPAPAWHRPSEARSPAPGRNPASAPSLAVVPAAPSARPPEQRHEAVPANVPHQPHSSAPRVEHPAPQHVAPPRAETPRPEAHTAPRVSAPSAPVHAAPHASAPSTPVHAAPQHAAPAHTAPPQQHNSSSERKNGHQ